MKRCVFIALCLSALLLIGAGCAQDGAPPAPTPSATPEATPSPTPVETAEPAPTEEPFDYAAALQSAWRAYEPDTVVLTVNGRPIVWEDYFYWLADQIGLYCSYFGELPPWEEDFDVDVSYDDYFHRYADNTVIYLLTLEGRAEEMEVTLSPESERVIDETWTALVQTMGSEEEALAYLERYCMTKENYDWINHVNLLYTEVFEKLYGERAEGYSDAETMAFAEEQGYMRAKHILFKTTDESGMPLPEEEQAAALTKAEETLAELQALSGAELAERFDARMQERSGDEGLLHYPDGYIFQAETMVESFSTATQALEPGEMSGLVESPFGYHIILRLPLDPDLPTEYDSNSFEPISLRFSAAYAEYQETIDSWIDGSEILYAEEFAEFQVRSLFEPA